MTKFHVQLALPMIFMLIVFMAGIERTENRTGCIIVGVLLHYFILVTWMWTAAEAMLMFQKMVVVFTNVTGKFVIFVSIICWGEKMSTIFYMSCYHCLFIGIPAIPVAISVGINSDYYIIEMNNITGQSGL